MLAGFSSFGFVGSRSGVGSRAAFRLAQSAAVAGCGIFATCGKGAPAAAISAAQVSQALPVVFTRAQFPALPVRAQFAARAAAMVRALAAGPSPVLVCWPGSPAPSKARPARSWVSCGSGTWSEAALAVGLGVPVFVFLPSSPPAWWGSWQPVGSGPFAGSWHLPAAPALF